MKVPKAWGAGLAQGVEASKGLEGAGGRGRSRPGPTGLPWQAAGGRSPNRLVQGLCVKKQVFSLVEPTGVSFTCRGYSFAHGLFRASKERTASLPRLPLTDKFSEVFREARDPVSGVQQGPGR